MVDPWTASGGWWWLWPFGWIFFILLMVIVMRLIFYGRGWRHPGYRHWGGYYGGPPPGHVPAEEILRQRLAKGEIDEQEYRRLKDFLEK
jgi:hypothetical protein